MNVALFLEMRNEYTEHLVDIITPFIYEGLNSIYRGAVRIVEQENRPEKTLLIFQKLLQAVASWNQLQIDEETTRIKQASNTDGYFDDLVKAVIKSNIILLAYSNTISNMIAQTFYNNLTTSTFIHRCYTECAKDARNNPYLFYHDVSPMDLKRNQIIIQQNIQAAIPRAVRKILPISMILKEYLLNSINIIAEPPKVELIGLPSNNIDKIPVDANTVVPVVANSKIDSRVENQVLNIINSENAKSDKQKLQAIMNIDKIITDMETDKLNTNIKRTMTTTINKSSTTKKSTTNAANFMIPPQLLEMDDNNDTSNDIVDSNKKILNIEFDNLDTVDASNKSISYTTLSGKSMNRNAHLALPNQETSERIDPNNANFIEDYGSMWGDMYKKKNNFKK